MKFRSTLVSLTSAAIMSGTSGCVYLGPNPGNFSPGSECEDLWEKTLIERVLADKGETLHAISAEQYADKVGRKVSDYEISRETLLGLSSPRLNRAASMAEAHISLDEERERRGYEAVVGVRIETEDSRILKDFWNNRYSTQMSGVGVRLKSSP